MGVEDVKDRFDNIRDRVISNMFSEHISPKTLEEDWDVEGLQNVLEASYGSKVQLKKIIDDGLDVDDLLRLVQKDLTDAHNAKEQLIGAETMRTFEKAVMLRALDHHWKEHLAVMDQLRQSVNLRGYGQKNPVQEFKRESFSMFTTLLDTINIEMVKAVCSLNLEQNIASSGETTSSAQKTTNKQKPKNTTSQDKATMSQKSKALKVGRNDPCPCGSGKKYKLCHG